MANYLITTINLKPNVINIYSWCPIFSVVTKTGPVRYLNYVIGTDSIRTFSIEEFTVLSKITNSKCESRFNSTFSYSATLSTGQPLPDFIKVS